MPPFPDPAARALLEASERGRLTAAALTHGAVACYRDARKQWEPGAGGLLHVPSYSAGMQRALELLSAELARAGLEEVAATLEDGARLIRRHGPPSIGPATRAAARESWVGGATPRSGGKTP